MIRLAALLLLAATGSAAAQDAVPVRSGEHETFTRLVFPARAGLDWALDQSDDGRVTLRFDDPGLRFDIGTVFDRVPRTRLADLSAAGPSLSLGLGCDCSVSVAQIGSGHVVIDVAAALPEAAPTPPTLPRRLGPVPALTLGLSDATSRPPPPEAPAPTTETVPAAGAQISIRQQGGAVLAGPPADTADLAPPATCALEPVAAELLRRDPAAALAEIAALRARLFDEIGRPDRSAHVALAGEYLAAGFGAEAEQALRAASGDPEADMLLMARALDGLPGVDAGGAGPDPFCGPATATLALLSGADPGDWLAAEETAFRGFVDTLPRGRRADLAPRLETALARLGRPGLAPASEPAPADGAIEAAGTDGAAVAAAIGLLGAAEGPPMDARLGNGLALRRSVPEGPLRADLDRALALELAATGHLSEAVAIVEDRPSLAGDALREALDRLPPEEAVVAALRLRPLLAPGDPGAARAAALLRGYGLDDLARSFGARAAEADIDGPPGAAPPAPEGEAWLRRDFARLDPASPRGRVAAQRRDRNAAPPAGTDFERARKAAADARALSTVLADLIGAEAAPGRNGPLTP